MAIPITRNTVRTRLSRTTSLLLLVAIVTGVVVLGTTRSAGNGIQHVVVVRIPRSIHTSPPADLNTDLPSLPRSTQAPWVVAENQLSGTSNWRIPKDAPTGIEGFADVVSAQVGDTVTLYVSTSASAFHVEAYRIGYYQGLGGRFIWRSARQRGHDQPSPTLTSGTNMIEAPWSPSLRIHLGDDWPQGVYMLKLVASNGAQSYIPLTLRDDSSHAALVIQNSVTTWQAYNGWGGYSLYHGVGGSFGTRSRVVSFDRPYEGRRGSADFFWIESPVVFLAERLGLDVTYWTDIDLHERPGLLMNHAALISLGHDEYWSSDMLRGALFARSHGINLAFLGANDVYRHIRLVASPLGKDRREVNYKVASEDPLYGVDNEEVTSQWREAPMPRPESALLGGLYQCNPVHADMVISVATSWVFAGTRLTNGDRLPGAVDLEYDRVDGRLPTPASVQILAHSPLTCRGRSDFSDLTYYTTRSGGGVIDTASQGWIALLTCQPPQESIRCNHRAVRITANILRTFSEGPAGIDYPSRSNVARFGIRLEHPLHV
jgi:N,N-dimethylformamidase beta subunit-like protein